MRGLSEADIWRFYNRLMQSHVQGWGDDVFGYGSTEVMLHRRPENHCGVLASIKLLKQHQPIWPRLSIFLEDMEALSDSLNHWPRRTLRGSADSGYFELCRVRGELER